MLRIMLFDDLSLVCDILGLIKHGLCEQSSDRKKENLVSVPDVNGWYMNMDYTRSLIFGAMIDMVWYFNKKALARIHE